MEVDNDEGKKDVYVIIARENTRSLFEIETFIPRAAYSDFDREMYKDDIGKIETKNFNFRYIYHKNVSLITTV